MLKFNIKAEYMLCRVAQIINMGKSPLFVENYEVELDGSQVELTAQKITGKLNLELHSRACSISNLTAIATS